MLMESLKAAGIPLPFIDPLNMETYPIGIFLRRKKALSSIANFSLQITHNRFAHILHANWDCTT